jgi:hypothetical protein
MVAEAVMVVVAGDVCELRGWALMAAANEWVRKGSGWTRPLGFHRVDLYATTYLPPHLVHRAPTGRGDLLSASMAPAADPLSATSPSSVGSHTDRDAPSLLIISRRRRNNRAEH